MIINSIINGEFQLSNDGVYGEGLAISVVLSPEELAQILEAYDPSSSTSPSVSTCRPIVRLMLDEIGKKNVNI